MGLDGVELLMNLEEAFGIGITDEEATNCKTPRIVVDLIVSKLNMTEEHVCRSQRAFYIIRRLLIRTFSLERKSIQPDIQLRDFFPEPRQKELWEQLKAALAPSNWPPLERPLWMSRGILALPLAAFTAGAVIELHWSGHIIAAVGSGVALAVLLPIIAFVVTRPNCTCIPASIISIRDVIPYAMTSEHMIGWTREEVSAVVKRLTMDQLGLDEASYTEDSRFIEDFNMG